jgi:APA family basic amino acid/polyamine antiporter/amino acid efflux transporter
LTEKETEIVLPTRTIKLSSSILYGIGCGIGGSVFILLGTAINTAQSGVLISLILGGILIFLTALNYSELSTSLPVSGGAYNFSKEALGGFLAFIIGFFLWIANIATFSFSAQAFVVVIGAFFPVPEYISIIIAVLSILFTTIVLFRTQKIALKSLITLTIVLIVIFGIFIISGFLISPITNASNLNLAFLSTNFSFLSVVTMFSVLFILFTSITSNLAYLNADLKNPSKNILKANIVAILITLLIHISISIVTMINIGGNPNKSPILLALVLYDILGLPGYILMGVAATISTFIAMNAALGSAVSVMSALARDHYVSQKLLKVRNKKNTPNLILVITTSIAIFFTILAIIFANIGFTANITTFIYLFGLAFVNFAAVNLRYKRKELDRPYKAPFFPYLPIVVGSICLIIAFALNTPAVILGLIFFIIGVSYYLLTIADRHSPVFTLAGLKFFAIFLVGVFIWIINNFGTISSPLPGFSTTFTFVILRILIVVGVISFATIFFDIIPLKELVFVFIKRLSKKEVAIDMGMARIIELTKVKSKIIYFINIGIGAIQILSSIFVFSIIALFTLNLISIENLSFGSMVVPQQTGEFLFLSILIFLGVTLLLSGPFSLYLNRETKSLGI